MERRRRRRPRSTWSRDENVGQLAQPTVEQRRGCSVDLDRFANRVGDLITTVPDRSVGPTTLAQRFDPLPQRFAVARLRTSEPSELRQQKRAICRAGIVRGDRPAMLAGHGDDQVGPLDVVAIDLAALVRAEVDSPFGENGDRMRCCRVAVDTIGCDGVVSLESGRFGKSVFPDF